jgi:hypothetical protein
MEREFLYDFAHFGISINVDALLALRSAACVAEDFRLRKRLCVAGLQLFYSSLEDFAVLLQAILARKRNGRFLHMSLGGEGQRLGTTTFPAILKRTMPARLLFDELGFVNVTVDRLQELDYDLTEATLDACFSDFADSIKYLATSATDVNELKNRLKHGKAVWGFSFGLDGTENVTHIEFSAEGPSTWHYTTASLEQLEVAAITTAKLSIHSVDLISMYAAQYYGIHAYDFVHAARDAGEVIVEKARGCGLRSVGLTE